MEPHEHKRPERCCRVLLKALRVETFKAGIPIDPDAAPVIETPVKE